MRDSIRLAVVGVLLSLSCAAATAASFSYHGQLQDAGKPADGDYDIELTLYSAALGGKVLAGPLTINRVHVSQGSFTTHAEFGPLADATVSGWLGVKVRPVGQGDFAALSTRSIVTPDANTSCPGSWSLDGNAGNPAGSYLGTTDTALVLKAQGQQVLISDVSGGGTVPRWIGGGSLNSSSGGQGAFIGGGGSNAASANANRVGKFCVVAGGDSNTALGTAAEISGGATGYATIAGGQGNTASGYAATVSGGGGYSDDGAGHQVLQGNLASGPASAISGGQDNTAGGLWSSVAGGSGNTAAGEGAAILGGEQNSASARGAVVAGGTLNTASGVAGFTAGGVKNVAAGGESFAAGYYAQANHSGSFVWSDASTATPFASSGVNQFLLRASGGAAINGTPKNTGVELSIYPNAGGYNYSSVYYGIAGDDAGILTSAGDATPGHNDASFYFDQYDGSNQLRKLSIKTSGIIVNDPGDIPVNAYQPNLALQVVHASGTTAAEMEFYPAPSVGVSYEVGVDPAGQFGISKTSNSPTAGGGTFTSLFLLDHNGDLNIYHDAYKPGGGSWSVSSDRRIKNRVTPIVDAVDTLLKLHPVDFHYTAEYRALEGGLADRAYAGFIAQDFAEVFPEAVTATQKRVPGSAASDPPILALDPNPALITTVAAVQELALENVSLRKQLDQLAARLEKLEARSGE